MPEKKSKKSFPKVILVILILVVLITGGYFAIRSNQVKNEIKYQIISKIENAIDRGIYIGRVKNYSLKSITLSDFKVFKNRSLLDEDQIFEAEEIIVNYDLDFLSALKREVPLSVEDITLVKPRMTLIRDSQGTFDFMEKFNLSTIGLFSIKGVNVKEGNLDYIDYQTTKENGLLTSLKQLNGYFYLAELPKVEFSCSAKREEDDSPLLLEGYFFTGKVDYVLDFTFKDAEIAHFQYYFVQDEILKVKKGLFDSNLRLANNLGGIPGKVNWQGKVSVKDVNLYSSFLDNLEIKQVYGSAIFNSQEISIESITAIYQNSPFSLQGDLTYADKFCYNIKVKSDNFKLSDLAEEAKKYLSLSADFPLEGSSNLEIEVSGLENNFQVNGKLSTKEGNIGGYEFLNLSAGFNYDSVGIYLKEIKAEVAGGLIKGTGGVNLSKEVPEYTFSFDFSRLDTQSDLLKPLVSNYLKSGLLSGKVDLKGIIAEGEETNLTAKIKVEDNELGDFLLQAEGTITKDNYMDLKLKAEEISLEGLGETLNYKEIEGQANFIGTLSGLLENPKIKGKIEVREGQISGLPFNYLEGKIDYQGNILKLEDLLFQNEGLTFKGGGSADFFETKDEMEIKVSLQVEQADLNYLAKYFSIEPPLSGSAQGDIFIQSRGSQFEANGDLQIKKINIINYKADSANLIFSLKDKKVRIKSLVLNSGKSQLYVQGEVSLEEGLPLDLRVNFLNQRIVHLMSYFLPPDLLSKFRGKATGSLEIKGDYASPDLFLSALIEDAQLEKMPINSIEVKLDKIDSVIRINRLKLSQRKGELIAGGWINLDEDNKNLDINLSADNLDLNQLSNLFGIEDEIKGLANFKAEVTGDIDLPNISFSAKVEKGKFQDFIFDNLTFEALYNQGILEVKQFVLDKEGHQIIGKGKIPYEFSFMGREKVAPSLAEIPLDFNLALQNTDLSFIKIFFPKDLKQIRGLTNAELKLSGTLNQPILNGNIALSGGLIEFYELPAKISDLSVLLYLENNLVKIEDMNFKIDQYRIYTSGEFALKNLQLQDLNINIWTNKEEILYQDIFKAQADLKAKLTGFFTSPHIEGILTLSQGELNWKDNNKDIPTNTSELFSKLINVKGDIDLEVKILDDFMAKANDFNLKLVGGLKVQGDLSAPKLNGGLQIKQGYIAFLDKKFRVSEGKVIFADSIGEDMILDIRAKTEIDDIDVFLNVSGILAQPTITLSSSPALSESEIISLLMFNKNYAGLTEGEMGTILQEEIINLIAQGLSIRFLNQIEDKVADSFGLDEFKIETIFKKDQDSNLTFFPGFALEALAFKVGKYFSENFYLTYSAPLFEIGIGNLELEYKLKNDLTLSTQVGSVGLQDDEFELKFELQYEF
ncbi:translocation/assembly module TamB domain-containing protein [bacterium]|nr:translocation/assembly module TamB domain-containing protein [bacterium]